MRLLHLHDESWDSGIAHYALTLSLELSRRGHALEFWARRASSAAEAAKRAGLVVRELRRPWLSAPRLAAAARRFRPDVVNAFTGSMQSLGAALCAASRARLVRTCADARPPKAHALARALSRRTAAYAAANSALAAHLRRAFPKARVVLLPQGIAAPADEPPALPQERAVGLLGRFDAVKGHDDLVRAAALLTDREINVVVLFAGAGRREREVALAAGTALPENSARFYGRVPRVADFISECRVGCVPSTGSEAVSRAALEWMAMGRPVVATRVGGLPDIVEDGVTGLLVAPRRPQALARAIEELLETPGLCERMGRAARKRWEALYSLKAFGDAAEELYGSLL